MKRFFKLIAAGFLINSALLPGKQYRQRVPQFRRGGSGTPDLARLTVKELRALATAMKIKGRSKAGRKAQLVALVEKASR